MVKFGYNAIRDVFGSDPLELPASRRAANKPSKKPTTKKRKK